MKNKFKRFITFPIAAVLVFSVSCGKSSESTQSYESKADISLKNTGETAEIVYALWQPTPDVNEQKVIDEFNRSNNGYKLVIKDYSEYLVTDPDDENLFTEDSVTAMNIQITKDITDGIIDVVSDRSFADSMYYEKLLKQGAFSDLYGFMKNDEEVNTTSLNEHILSIHETDAKLCVLPVSYTIDTLMGESRYVGNNENWTLDDLISYWNAMPSGSVISGHTEKNYVYYCILRETLGSYVDYKNAKVSFDSESFKKALEFCNSFDSMSDYKSEPDSSAPNFIDHLTIAGFSNFHIQLYNDDDEQMTFVGYPSDDGNGSYINSVGSRFSICSTSSADKQNGAWQFIRRLAMPDYQIDNYAEYDEINEDYYQENGFPINNAVFDEMANESKMGKFKDSTISFCGVEKEVGLLTDEELNRLKEYINSIDSVYAGLDRDLFEITEDEVLSYFKGEKSVDQAIKMIQNRAAIMVSEKN